MKKTFIKEFKHGTSAPFAITRFCQERKRDFGTEFFIIPCVICICVLLASTISQGYLLQHRIEKHGIFTDGTAYYAEFRSIGKAGSAHFVRYLFFYNGIKYNSESKVQDDWVRTAKFPCIIRVQFLQDNPLINLLPDVGVRESLFVDMAMLFILLCIVVYLGVRIRMVLKEYFLNRQMSRQKISPAPVPR